MQYQSRLTIRTCKGANDREAVSQVQADHRGELVRRVGSHGRASERRGVCVLASHQLTRDPAPSPVSVNPSHPARETSRTREVPDLEPDRFVVVSRYEDLKSLVEGDATGVVVCVVAEDMVSERLDRWPHAPSVTVKVGVVRDVHTEVHGGCLTVHLYGDRDLHVLLEGGNHERCIVHPPDSKQAGSNASPRSNKQTVAMKAAIRIAFGSVSETTPRIATRWTRFWVISSAARASSIPR